MWTTGSGDEPPAFADHTGPVTMTTEMVRLLEQSTDARKLAARMTHPAVKQMLIAYAVDKEQRFAALDSQATPLMGGGIAMAS